MWLLISKAILSSIVGSSFYNWWRNTRMGIWFQKKLDNTLEKIQGRYDWQVFEKEQKWQSEYPNLAQRIKDLEDQLDDVQGRVHSLEREGVVGDFYD